MAENRPVIAVPMGDPAGIGPEIVLRAAMSREVNEKSRFIVVGDAGVLRLDGRYDASLVIHVCR